MSITDKSFEIIFNELYVLRGYYAAKETLSTQEKLDYNNFKKKQTKILYHLEI